MRIRKMVNVNKVLSGIDFGAKGSGNTVISVISSDCTIEFFQSKRGEDADAFICSIVGRYSPEIVGIDAPLSLPEAYLGVCDFPDYHYRQCDRELHAMSPMFLGGLTARAVSIKHQLLSKGSAVLECYPKALMKLVLNKDLKIIYKKDQVNQFATNLLCDALEEFAPGGTSGLVISNWHIFDSLLVLLSVLRYSSGKAQMFGNEKEGLIYV